MENWQKLPHRQSPRRVGKILDGSTSPLPLFFRQYHILPPGIRFKISL
jgi:hypothetical protein